MRPSLIQVTYETTFAEVKLRDDASARLSAALGIDIRPIELAQQPNQIEKREMISNYEEIREVAALALADVQRAEAYNRSRYRRLENVREMKLLAKLRTWLAMVEAGRIRTACPHTSRSSPMKAMPGAAAERRRLQDPRKWNQLNEQQGSGRGDWTSAPVGSGAPGGRREVFASNTKSHGV